LTADSSYTPPPESPLFAAISGGDLSTVKSILEQEPDRINAIDDVLGRAPLHYACAKNQPDIVAYLIEQGADVNLLDDYGDAPLELARDAEASDKLMQTLKDNGADD